ncbi:uncharacterized protein I303_108360 [Kwoniella dejecticola CBS 10117]|uniref:Pali-domain-containing protein n=1 Tax=Kwoniella dejecticola CBS 10117 TaxID=1296121 RepID=A0A1A5ZXL9_9TREE|nr:uncharacterized protein I303_07312 [Kwoniella dejecticola CBS 10117]OBR82552.1 hypothetical protein I303_07312 [Kwoniella dejecticola CBS 10117]
MSRKGDAIWKTFLALGISIVALIPFTFYLINSLGPVSIHSLSLAKITGEFIDETTNQSTLIRVRVGPSGGCVWSNITDTTTCTAHLPYKPSSEALHLAANETISSAFPIAMGRALALNHVTTALMGLSILAVAIDCLVLHGGISLAIVYFTIFFMWITFILETVYVSTLHKRLDHLHNDQWKFNHGEGYWFILAATIFVSILSCGCNFSVDF